MTRNPQRPSPADLFSYGSTRVFQFGEPHKRRTNHAKALCPRCGGLYVPGPAMKKHREACR